MNPLRSLTILAVVLLPFAVMVGCESKPVASTAETDPHEFGFLNLAGDVAFTGDTACFDCHEDQYHGFNEHGMANSMYLLTNETAVEAFGSEIVVDSVSGLRYETVASDSGYFMIEYLETEDGTRTHELAREMQWVVGSGTTARTYLVEEDGWFYEMPVTWYTQKERWDFSPGYRVANKRFDRKIADRCVVCHNSYPTPVVQTNGMFTDMPAGIGCERCHGPGQLHVDERLASGDPAGDIDYTIVNPVHLPLDLRLDVCQQCHLNGSVSLLRDDRTPYDYRPSEDLSSFVALYNGLENTDEEGISVISHADRMMMSACFTETLDSLEPMECTTCHNPHEGFRTSGPDYFNATCMNCHAADQLSAIDAGKPIATHTEDANCIDCHMPKTDLVEAPHSAFTDHWIRVVSDGDLQPERTAEVDVLTAHFESDQRSSPQTDQYEGMAYITRGFQGGEQELIQKGIDLIESAAERRELMSEARYLLGYGYVLLGQPEDAIPPLEEALRLEPDKAERLNTLAQAYEQAGNRAPVRIERLYRQALRVQPRLADIRVNLGRFLQANGRLSEAKAEYELAIDAEEWNPLGWYNLGTVQLQMGDLAEAEATLRKALELNPLYGPTMSNLGLVMLQQERIEDALEILETSVARDVDHVDSLENLGSLYLNLERDTDAAIMLRRAADAAPGSAEIHAKLALALFRIDLMDDAGAAARRALQIDPSHPLANQIVNAL